MKLAIFDIDGTLAKTNRIDGVCFSRAFAGEFTIELADTNWSNYENATDSGIIHQVFGERFNRVPSAEELLLFQNRFVRLLEEAFASSPQDFYEVAGAANIFANLRARSDWCVAIATGGWRASALYKLSRIGVELDDHTPAAFADDGFSKEEIIKATLRRAAGIKFERVVYIGDSIRDLRAAKRLGIEFVGIRHHGNRDGRFQDEAHLKILEDFSDLNAFIRAIEED